MSDIVQADRARRYPQELKDSVVRRYLSTSASYRELAREIGGSTWTVRGWVREYRKGSMGPKTKSNPTDKRSAEEKLRLLLQAQAVSEEERGEFLRREGVHDGDLERWAEEALSGLRGLDQSESQLRRIRELERERHKQDKRLKEATALLELQKKVQALWADEDDDTSHS